MALKTENATYPMACVSRNKVYIVLLVPPKLTGVRVTRLYSLYRQTSQEMQRVYGT